MHTEVAGRYFLYKCYRAFISPRKSSPFFYQSFQIAITRYQSKIDTLSMMSSQNNTENTSVMSLEEGSSTGYVRKGLSPS